MKKTKTQSNTEAKEVAVLREKLRAWRFEFGFAKVKNVKEGKSIRKEIARMLTLARKEALANTK